MAPIAIACGDFAGIGPEVTLKAVADLARAGEPSRYVLVGDRNHLRAWASRVGVGELPDHTPASEAPIAVLDPRSQPLPVTLKPGESVSALAALEYLEVAARGALNGAFAAVVTAPVSKEAILRAGKAFIGQTEFLAELAGNPPVTMMLLGDDPQGRWLRVALVTTHLPLRDVPDAITGEAVVRAIRHGAMAGRNLGLARVRVGVCGLNPHAGEGGMLGDEEVRVLQPAIDQVRSMGVEVVGPVGADTLFHEALEGRYEIVVAMYHDQGLGPLKLAAFANGVNWTLGLPLVRTSPDHGTAFNIAGRGIADASSMRAALRLAGRLAKHPLSW